MDLNQIYYFVTVIECGSYTKAAQKLSTSKSTLTRQVQALEDRVQTRLLNRSTRKLSLTKAGELFFNRCLPQVTHLQNAFAETSQYHKDVTGHLRITTTPELGVSFLSAILPTFLEQHPHVKIELDLSSSNQNLIEQGYDLALRIGELEDSNYIAKCIAIAKMSLYASPNYLIKTGGVKNINELYKHQYIVVNNNKKALPIKKTKSTKLTEPILIDNYQLSSNSMAFNKLMCIEGQGLAVLPDALCEEEIKENTLIKVLPNIPFEKFNIYAVYPSRIHPTKALTTLIEFIANELSKLDNLKLIP